MLLKNTPIHQCMKMGQSCEFEDQITDIGVQGIPIKYFPLSNQKWKKIIIKILLKIYYLLY